MKKTVLLLMALMPVLLTGCDFFRAIAGRPVSTDIENKRIAIIKAEEEALQFRLDSLRLAEERIAADSLAAFEAFKAAGVMMSSPKKLGGLSGTELSYRYYIIIGAFRESDNARKLFDKAYVGGYAPVLIGSRNGMISVGVSPSDRIADIDEAYVRLKGEKFFPKGAWILINE